MKLSIKLFSGIPVLADVYDHPKSQKKNELFKVNDRCSVYHYVKYEDGSYGCSIFFKNNKRIKVQSSYIGKLEFQTKTAYFFRPYEYIIRIDKVAKTGFVIFNKQHDPLYYFETFSKKL